MKNIFLSALLGLSVSSSAPAAGQGAILGATTRPQPCGTFSGRVVADEKPLAGVSVFVKGTSIILITNEEGFFTIPSQVIQFPTLAVSAAGYAPQELTYTSCVPVTLQMQLLPGTRIKQHGKRKGFIMKTGS